MAKSKRKKKQKAQAPAATAKPITTSTLVLIAIAVLAVGGGGWWWYTSNQADAAFLALAAQGKPALENVVRQEEGSSGHLQPGERAVYRYDPPTSGGHDPQWTIPGVYVAAQRRDRLVHSLEHGMVVIYFDKPEADVAAKLENWASLYAAPWSGIVLTPKPGLGEAILLTAWRKHMRLEPFDAAAAAAFIDAYRGRGPERAVR